MSFFLQENGDELLQENGDNLLLEDFTLFSVFNDVTGKYDLLGLVFNDSTGKYDILGFVGNSVIGKYDMIGVVNNTLTGCYDINGDASTIITSQTKQIQLLQNNIETILVEKTDGAFNYSFWLFLSNMISGDEIEIKVYVWNKQTLEYELYESPIIRKSDLVGQPVTQTQDDKTAFFLPPIQSDRIKITINQTVGTPKIFDWVLYKQ